MEFWKKFIAFEKSNPLRSEDTALVTKRVMFATEQCLLVLTHHPAVWHQAAQYLDQSSKNFMEKGVRIEFISFNPHDHELSFSLSLTMMMIQMLMIKLNEHVKCLNRNDVGFI